MADYAGANFAEGGAEAAVAEGAGAYTEQAGYGTTVTSEVAAAYQHQATSQIKSNPEHGKILKKGVMGPSDLKMFIGGLSHDTTTDKLWEYFSKFGEVEDVDIKTDPNTGCSRGFGFLLYKSEEAIEQVVNNGPHNLDGKRIDPKKATKNSKIFIGGIKPETTDDQIKEFFAEFGEIDQLDRGRDKENPANGRPFAFMVMKKETAAGKITEQKWHQLDGKRVECKLAVDRQKRQQQWGGQMGYGGYGGYGAYGAYGGGYAGYGGYDYGPSFNQGGYGSFQQGGQKQNRYQPY